MGVVAAVTDRAPHAGHEILGSNAGMKQLFHQHRPHVEQVFGGILRMGRKRAGPCCKLGGGIAAYLVPRPLRTGADPRPQLPKRSPGIHTGGEERSHNTLGGSPPPRVGDTNKCRFPGNNHNGTAVGYVYHEHRSVITGEMGIGGGDVIGVICPRICRPAYYGGTVHLREQPQIGE